MRCDQYIGLNKWARTKVQSTHVVHEVGHRILPDGRMIPFNRKVKVPVARVHVIGKIKGAWTRRVAYLHRYTFPGGQVFEEYVQEVPWSGGPCYFVALKDAKGQPVPESLWTRRELDNA